MVGDEMKEQVMKMLEVDVQVSEQSLQYTRSHIQQI